MHGLIHIILKDLVVSKFGEEKWAAIGAKLGLAESGDGPILEEKQYPDETTVAGIATTAEVLGVSFEDALKVYGAHFVHFVYKGGHLQMLHSMGDSLEEFLKNVNHLHYTLERTYREGANEGQGNRGRGLSLSRHTHTHTPCPFLRSSKFPSIRDHRGRGRRRHHRLKGDVLVIQVVARYGPRAAG
mmetsp:Transcript_89537/g.255745  ORF Transcript_89537/g.255745 Transcript_89537/m.255745 type:complete len:186 (+) Transcript_89537:179-736(+)